MEDDSWSGKPSTSRTKVNVEGVKQAVSGDCQLTVRMIASQLDIRKNII